MASGYISGCFVSIDPFNFAKIETSYERFDRLHRELADSNRQLTEAREENMRLASIRNECLQIVGSANVVNSDELSCYSVGLADRCRRLRQFAEMAEAAECDLREEVATLRNELADVCGALASVTDRLAATAA